MAHRVVTFAALVGLLGATAGLAARPQGDLQAIIAKPVLQPGVAAGELRAFIREGIPALPKTEEIGGWNRNADKLRKRILDEVVLGGVPPGWLAGKPNVQWLDTIKTPYGYEIRKLRYEAVPGLWVPALLYQPDKLSGRVPAVLNVNGHVGAPGKATPYEQIRCINLAKRGLLALHPEWLGCGELSNAEYSHNRLAYLDLAGVRGVSIFYLAMRRGLDVLAEHPNTDTKRIAMTGLSGGGWQTVLLSALDTRISATAPNAGYIGLAERLENPGDIGDLEQNPADLMTLADYTHMTALLAPRWTALLYNEKDDCCFASPRARTSVYEPLKPFFPEKDRDQRFTFHTNLDPGNHNYERDNREQFYRLLNRAFKLKNPKDDEIPSDGEVKTFDELKCGIPSTNATFASLTKTVMESLPERRLAINSPWTMKQDIRAKLRELWKLPTPAKAEVSEPVRVENIGLETTITSFVYRVGNKWSVPVVRIFTNHSFEDARAIVIYDGGRAALGPRLSELRKRYVSIDLVDLAAMGESLPREIGRGQWAMMMGTTGRSLLGVQVAQLASILAVHTDNRKTRQVSVIAFGKIASTIALCEAAVSPAAIPKMELYDLPPSFRTLIESGASYDATPELFCPSLAKLVDIRELLVLAKAGDIRISVSAANRARMDAEVQPINPDKLDFFRPHYEIVTNETK